MLTNTEIDNIIKQVNVSFNEDRARISKLEGQVKELEVQLAKVTTPKAKQQVDK